MTTEPNAPKPELAPGPEGEPAPEPAPGEAQPPAPSRAPRASQGETPLYKGEPLEAERGPGLGCFWFQVILLGILLVLTPLTVLWAWDERISAGLFVVTLLLLLFAGQTVIFLLRLVAADRRTRRVPRSPAARRTVGMLEDGALPAPGAMADEPVASAEGAASPDAPTPAVDDRTDE